MKPSGEKEEVLLKRKLINSPGKQWTVDRGEWTVDRGQWTVDSGQGTVWTQDDGGQSYKNYWLTKLKKNENCRKLCEKT